MGKHWWSDGIDIKEWLTFTLVLVYAAVALVLAIKIYNKGLAAQDNEFFWTLSWPVIIITGFYFAEKIALGFGSARLPRFTITSQKDGGSANEDQGNESEIWEADGKEKH